ncbi:phospho-N-acetylmuramoyl-pentapeptide-transferase [Rummeliibacillus sp. TYF005]|uniref:phospho-N-acetylmuramoyl-pentapeptide- transferase n=1 Tax=Rummeliibacillus sp. TYF005 TaxID=2058214 RepID=UPI000F538561|nr:phospho-N-acetylmuramoyl-pentapeptide-transferase [Rummeliibacillus sp. TYF005]RPJ96896.1 phospho-N-acetylmuramoyl-pentapeptide-transferase [Rummeliibacillus sp. TYF005]
MSIATMLIILAISFIISVILGPIIIPLLRRFKFGQSIREEGPKSHMKKAGTPTMGGVIFLLSIIATTVIMSLVKGAFTSQTIILVLVLIGFGVVGFLDDGLKIIFKRNLGLTSLQKLIAQIVISIAAYFLLKMGTFHNTVQIPFTDFAIHLGLTYVLFLVFWLVGFSNAVNLTDGLDGLVSGTASIAFAAYGVLALLNDQLDAAIFAFSVVGALLGFLIFNANPAKVFMGDTGSLALGGALAMLSILVGQELLLLLIGIIFVLETLSVMMQVTSFKLTGKRIFKMSPLHHHFELSGWSEWRIVLTFWLTALVAALIAVVPEVL